VLDDLLSLLDHLVEILTHHDLQFSNDDSEEEEDDRGLNGNDLGDQLQEADSAGAVETAPRLHQANFAGSTNDLRSNLAVERSVEGHDGLSIFGKHGRGDTDEGNGGGDLDQERHVDVDAHNDEEINHNGSDVRLSELSLLVPLEVAKLGVASVDCGEGDDEDVGSTLQGSSWCNVLEWLPSSRNTLVPAEWRGL
jgi:hypothetical protein